MGLARKNEEAAANLQESKRLQLVYKESKELNLQEPKESERIKRIKRMQWVLSQMQCVSQVR